MEALPPRSPFALVLIRVSSQASPLQKAFSDTPGQGSPTHRTPKPQDFLVVYLPRSDRRLNCTISLPCTSAVCSLREGRAWPGSATGPTTVLAPNVPPATCPVSQTLGLGESFLQVFLQTPPLPSVCLPLPLQAPVRSANKFSLTRGGKRSSCAGTALSGRSLHVQELTRPGTPAPSEADREAGFPSPAS